MIQVSLPAALRTGFGKGASRQLRMKNVTPAVVYSGGNEALALQFDSTVLYKCLFDLHGRNAVVTLQIDGDDKGERHVLVKEIQKNPVTDSLVHVDFFEITLDEPIIFSVPLDYVGVARGVDLGGELQVLRTSMKVKGVPLDVPDSIEVDITGLDRGESLTFSDVSLPDRIEMLDDASAVCVAVGH